MQMKWHWIFFIDKSKALLKYVTAHEGRKRENCPWFSRTLNSIEAAKFTFYIFPFALPRYFFHSLYNVRTVYTIQCTMICATYISSFTEYLLCFNKRGNSNVIDSSDKAFLFSFFFFSSFSSFSSSFFLGHDDITNCLIYSFGVST